MKRALITGITGMDGSHLADFLLDKGYEVFGMERRTSTKNRVNTSHLENKITFLMGDLTDQSSLFRVLEKSDPDEVYNLASQSFVKESWNTPEQSADATGAGTLRMLEAIRMSGKTPKFYQASTSEMFGKMEDLANVPHTIIKFKETDRLDHLAQRFLGSATYWWIICMMNGLENPFSYKLLPGFLLKIPNSPEPIINMIQRSRAGK